MMGHATRFTGWSLYGLVVLLGKAEPAADASVRRIEPLILGVGDFRCTDEEGPGNGDLVGGYLVEISVGASHREAARLDTD